MRGHVQGLVSLKIIFLTFSYVMIVSGAVLLGFVCLFRFFAFVVPSEWDPGIITKKIVPHCTVG